jgi:hypothetical protein
MEVIVGGTAVTEGDTVDVAVGCIGPEQATNRKRMTIAAWELIFAMIPPPYSHKVKPVAGDRQQVTVGRCIGGVCRDDRLSRALRRS